MLIRERELSPYYRNTFLVKVGGGVGAHAVDILWKGVG